MNIKSFKINKCDIIISKIDINNDSVKIFQISDGKSIINFTFNDTNSINDLKNVCNHILNIINNENE